MAITILPVMVMVHTTVAWIFGLISSRPLWFGTLAGPYFVAGAIASGIAAVIAIAAILRWLFHWQEILKPSIFKGLGNFLAIILLIYLYFMLSEQMTANYAGPSGEYFVTQDWLYGDYAVIFWPMLIFGLLIPCAYLLIQAFRPNFVSIRITALFSVIIVFAFCVKRYLIIIPTMTRGLGVLAYQPTYVELSIIVGT